MQTTLKTFLVLYKISSLNHTNQLEINFVHYERFFLKLF